MSISMCAGRYAGGFSGFKGDTDLLTKKKPKLYSENCLNIYGLDVPSNCRGTGSKWNFFDPHGVTFVANPENCAFPYSLIRKAPEIKYLVCEGGGAKGIAYPAFIRGLNRKTRFLENLEEVAGTSAGSLMASLLAAGVSLKEVEEIISAMDIRNYFGDADKAAIGDAVPLRKWSGWYSATKLAEFVQEKIYQSIKEYYDSLDPAAQEAMKKKFGDEFKKLEEGVTFKHLKWLHELDPKKFKRLHVVAMERNSKQPRYYNDETTATKNLLKSTHYREKSGRTPAKQFC